MLTFIVFLFGFALGGLVGALMEFKMGRGRMLL